MPRPKRQARLGTKGSVSEDLVQARAGGGLHAVRLRPRTIGRTPDLAGTMALLREADANIGDKDLFDDARQLLLDNTLRVVEKYIDLEPEPSGEHSRRRVGAESLQLLMLAEKSNYGRIGTIRENLSSSLGCSASVLLEAEQLLIDEIAKLVYAPFPREIGKSRR